MARPINAYQFQLAIGHVGPFRESTQSFCRVPTDASDNPILEQIYSDDTWKTFLGYFDKNWAICHNAIH